MAQKPRSSFIPKQTSSAIPSTVRRKKRFHVFNFLASTLLVGSLIAAGGAYFYKDYTLSQLESEKLALAEERNRFNEADILGVQAFERRLNAAEYRLDNHLSVVKIFDALELNTNENVQFVQLEFEQQPSQNVALTVKGGTETFKTVALQKMQFEEDPLFGDMLFTGISEAESSEEDGEIVPQTTEEARVNFVVEGAISPSLLAYTGSPSAADGQSDEDVQEEGDVVESGLESEGSNQGVTE